MFLAKGGIEDDGLGHFGELPDFPASLPCRQKGYMLFNFLFVFFLLIFLLQRYLSQETRRVERKLFFICAPLQFWRPRWDFLGHHTHFGVCRQNLGKLAESMKGKNFYQSQLSWISVLPGQGKDKKMFASSFPNLDQQKKICYEHSFASDLPPPRDGHCFLLSLSSVLFGQRGEP